MSPIRRGGLLDLRPARDQLAILRHRRLPLFEGLTLRSDGLLLGIDRSLQSDLLRLESDYRLFKLDVVMVTKADDTEYSEPEDTEKDQFDVGHFTSPL